MQTLDILICAKEIISDKNNWAQGEYHEKRDGYDCYCAIGALAKAAGVQPKDDIEGADLLALEATGGASNEGFWVARYNDDHTHEEVLDLFDKAIARASSLTPTAVSPITSEEPIHNQAAEAAE